MCRLCNVVVETVEELNLVLGLARLLSNDVFMLAPMSSMVGLPYSVKIFLQIVSKSPIMSIFSPVSIHPDCFALSARFLLNRLTYFDSPSNSSSIFIISLLKNLINVVEV